MSEPSVLVICRSWVGASVVVSVAELFAGVGSVVPDGGLTVAEFVSVPVASWLIVALTEYVSVEPTGKLTVSVIEPVPLAVHVAPPAEAHVQVAPISAAGRASATAAPTASDGPTLRTTIVYVVGVPGTAVATPSVLVMLRSASGVRVSVSVELLLANAESVTPDGVAIVAVLVIEPLAFDAIVAFKVYVTVAPTGKFTVSEIEPEPLAAQAPPPDPLQVHEALVSALGNASDTKALTTFEGPALEATIV